MNVARRFHCEFPVLRREAERSNMEDAGDLVNPDVADESVGTALVEIAPGTALLFGEDAPGMNVLPLELMSKDEVSKISQQLNASTGVLNLGAQGINGIAQARGLVRLAPETLKALESARPLTQGGYNLGTLVGQNGKMVAQVRWLPAAGAQAASIAAAMGPALALLAIQVQLAQISKLVRENIELTSAVLKALRIDKWSQLHGLSTAMRMALGEAEHVGVVSDKIWNNVSGKEVELRAVRKYFRDQVVLHTQGLASKKGHSERRKFLLEHANAILADVHGMLEAQSTWYSYEALRAGNVYVTAGADPRDEALLEKIARDAPAEYRDALRSAALILDDVLCEASLLAELDGKWTFPFGKEHRASKDVAKMAKSLRRALSELRDGLYEGTPNPLPVPAVVALAPGKQVPPKVLQILRWHMPEDERLLALAESYPDTRKTPGGCYLAVTDRRILIMDQGDFKRKGLVEREIPLERVRYTRYVRATKSKPPNITVFTPEETAQFNFSGWAKAANDQSQIASLAQLLTDAMHVPDDELLVEGSMRSASDRVPATSDN